MSDWPYRWPWTSTPKFDNPPAVWPQARAPVRCPVCLGKGLLPQGFYDFGPVIPGTGANAVEKCRSCGGRGIV